MTSPVKRYDTDAAAAYLTAKIGIQIKGKTLRNKRADGTGPKCDYFGSKPVYNESELDRWVEEDALTSENPVRRNMRLRAERRAARTSTPRNPVLPA
jgi:hypothetical protein